MVREAYLLAGATATGKSAAAAILARELGAAILSADSMLVYRGMDIGTAKPSPEERAEFDMGGVDLVTPTEDFSAGEWLRQAGAWAAKLPPTRPLVVVGGTGLYFTALLRGLDAPWQPPPPEYPVLQMDRASASACASTRCWPPDWNRRWRTCAPSIPSGRARPPPQSATRNLVRP